MSGTDQHMEIYRRKVEEWTRQLEELVDTVVEHFDDLPQEEVCIPRYEGVTMRLLRISGLVKTPVPVRIEQGVRFTTDNRRARFILRGNTRGMIVAQMSHRPNSNELLTPSWFVRDIITDNRWETPDKAAASFIRTYEAIAQLLPAGHALRQRSAAMSETSFIGAMLS